MRILRLFALTSLLFTIFIVSGCGSRIVRPDVDGENLTRAERFERERTTTLGQALRARRTEEQVTSVNRYIWRASLEVLNFMPIQTVDPFTGVIVTGYGTPPGGSRAYRATVLINDPALDARSLNLALQTRSGAASAATVRAVEDAILTRARQLRIADTRL